MMRVSFLQYIIFIFIPIIAIAALLYYVASNNVQQFFQHETELAVTSINNADAFVPGTLLAFITIIKHERLRFHAESKLNDHS